MKDTLFILIVVMITIGIVRMVMHPAVPVIDQMCRYYKYNSGNQQEGMVLKKYLLQHQKQNADCKKC